MASYTYHGGYLADQQYKEYPEGYTLASENLLGQEFIEAMARGKDAAEIVRDATTGYFINTGNTNTNKMERGYKVLKLQDLASQLKLPSSKGMKTKDYLALVINAVEDTGLRFVQFLQLVDVLYIIVQKVEHKQQKVQHVTLPPEKFRPEEEISRHYGYGDPVMDSQLEESTGIEVQEREPVTEEPPELEEVKKRDHLEKNLEKKPLPWKK